MTQPPTLRSFQDIRDVASETIHQVRNRDITGDQVKGIQGLLALAAETIVKEEAINRAIVANNSSVPGVPATTTPPPKGPKTTDGTFILNLNVNSPAPTTATKEVVEHHTALAIGEAFQLEVWEDAPEAAQIVPEAAQIVLEAAQIVPEAAHRKHVSIEGEEAAEHLLQARGEALDDITNKRRQLVERLRNSRGARK